MCGRCIADTWFRLQGVCYTESEPFSKRSKAFENTGLSLWREKATQTCPESGKLTVPIITKIILNILTSTCDKRGVLFCHIFLTKYDQYYKNICDKITRPFCHI